MEDLFATLLERLSGRRMHPKAVQGFLNTMVLMRIPTLYTLNEAETAQVISYLPA